MFELLTRISKFFVALLIIFKVSTKLFWWSNKIIFSSVFNKILDPSAKSFFPCTINANILIISLIFRRLQSGLNARTFVRVLFRVYFIAYIFIYVKLRVLCSAVRKHSVFVQPFVKLPRRLLSYFDISVRLVHVWIQTSSPTISRLLSSGQLRNLGKGPYRVQSSRNF